MVAIGALILAGLSLVTAGIIPSLPLQQRGLERRGAGGTCSSSQFAGVVQVGGAGTPFCESSWGTSYVPITTITVWSNDQRVTGVQVTYSDGTQSAVLGRTATVKGGSIAVDYATNDLWSRVSMYTVAGQYLRHLLIQTSSGGKLNAGENVASDPSLTRHDQPLGSQILFGVQGTTLSDGSLGALGFLFLASPISEIQISNYTFPTGFLGSSEGIAPTTLGSAHFYNDNGAGGSSVTYQFNNQLSETQSWAYAQTYTSTFAVAEAIQFQFGFNIALVKAQVQSTTTFTWTTGTTESTTTTVTQSEQVQYNAAVTLAPGQGVDCTAIAGQGSGTFPYTSTVTVTLKNGFQFAFRESGQLTVSAISQGEVSCTAANHP